MSSQSSIDGVATSAPPCVAVVDTSDTKDWFTKEVHAHDGQLKAYLKSKYPSVRDVDDVVQESYLRIWVRHLQNPVTSAKNFLFAIARNLAVDVVRRQVRSPVEAVSDLAALDVMEEGKANAAQAACTREEISLLLEAIESLPPRCREVLILRQLHGLSPREIADQLGITEGTVHVHGAKAVRRCEEFMRKRGVIGKESP